MLILILRIEMTTVVVDREVGKNRAEIVAGKRSIFSFFTFS